MTAEAQRLCDLLGLVGQHGRLLDAVRRGESNASIAAALSVRVGTVKSRLFKLYRRLGVANRVQAAVHAEHALLEERLRLAEHHALEQRHNVAAGILADAIAYLARSPAPCPCSGNAPDPGPHLPTCPWADPEYDPDDERTK